MANEPFRVELKLEGMTCLNCARTVERALRAVPGVDRASVSYADKSASIAASADVSVDDLVQAVERSGYGAEIVNAHGPSRTPSASHVDPESRGGAVDYEILIVGTGGAGMAAAIRASELGVQAAIVEAAEMVGGTCVNVGCIPSKNLIEAAHQHHEARTGFPGIAGCDPQLAWDEILRQKRELVDRLRKEKYLDVLATYEGITLLHGHAKLLGNGRVQVGERVVKARKIVIATGTRPTMPPVPGLAEAGALDSTTAMELERLPKSMIIIGGGSIGLELGQAFRRFGVQVIVVEAMERILPNEDLDVSSSLGEALRAEGLEIHTGVRVSRIERTEQGYRVSLERESLHGDIEGEQLLVATGRRANTADLGLEAAGVEIDGLGYIRVDQFMRTSNPDIFASGDVTGGPGFVYVAALQGGIAAQAAVASLTGAEEIPIDLGVVPRVTFTDPQVAAVGMTEADAQAAGLMPKVTSLPIHHLSRAAVSYRRDGVIKLIAESGSERLLGAHIVAPNAGDIIGEAALAIRFGLTTRDLVSTLHAYLTWGEGLKLAAQTFTTDVAKLSCCA